MLSPTRCKKYLYNGIKVYNFFKVYIICLNNLVIIFNKFMINKELLKKKLYMKFRFFYITILKVLKKIMITFVSLFYSIYFKKNFILKIFIK